MAWKVSDYDYFRSKLYWLRIENGYQLENSLKACDALQSLGGLASCW